MNFTVREYLISVVAVLLFFASAYRSVVAQFVCHPSSPASTALVTGSLTASDPLQTGRVVRDGRPSTCVGKTNSLQNSTPVNEDSYTFSAPATGCATLVFDNTGCGTATTGYAAYSIFTPAAPNTGLIGDSGFSSTATGSFSFPVIGGTQFTAVVYAVTPGSLCASYKFTVNYSTGCRQAGFDRTNDGKADETVFRPGTGDWFTVNSAGGTTQENFGLSSDVLTPGDYTGDGITDVSVYRPSNNTLYFGNNHTDPGHNFTPVRWGSPGDISVPGDYDRDGKTDVAVFRPSSGTWYVFRSSDSTSQAAQWGTSGDIPVAGDFDGDGIWDYGVVRPNDVASGGSSTWYILESNFGYGFFIQTGWGLATDKLVPADYDGDGKTDIAVFRPSDGNWYIIQSSVAAGPNSTTIHWGSSGDLPQPADYDGDKKADVAVFRPSDNNWYVRNSSNGSPTVVNWGKAGDIPTTSAYRIP